MTIIGRCEKCRGPRTVVTRCKVEAFPLEARPVEAMLCDPCIASFKVAIVTPLKNDEQPRDAVVEMYQ